MRRIQLSTHFLETELVAIHSRKASIKQRFAASEFAVRNRASLCNPIRSHSNTLTNSSLLAYSRLSFASQRTLLTSLSMPPQMMCSVCTPNHAFPLFSLSTLASAKPKLIDTFDCPSLWPRIFSQHGDATAEPELRTLHVPINRPERPSRRLRILLNGRRHRPRKQSRIGRRSRRTVSHQVLLSQSMSSFVGYALTDAKEQHWRAT